MSKNKMSVKQKHSILRMAVSIIIGLVLATVLIVMASDIPSLSLKYFFTAPVSSFNYFSMWLQRSIPLMITGVAVCIMFSANQFNLGLEGSFLLGGFFGGALSNIYLFKGHILLGIIGGCIIGGIVGAIITAIPAILERMFGASVMVTSLMMNYICLWLSQYLLFTYFKDPRTSAGTHYWTEGNTTSSPIFITKIKIGNDKLTIYWSLIIAIIFIVLGWIFLYRTKAGFQIRQTGQNKNFAKYIGISVPTIAITAQIIGGFIAGVGGAAEILSNFTSYSWQELTGYGWDGIMVAIFAANNPKSVPIAALFIGYLRTGAYIMSIKTGVLNDVTSIVIGVIVLFLLAEKFLQGTYRKMVLKEAEQKRASVQTEQKEC